MPILHVYQTPCYPNRYVVQLPNHKFYSFLIAPYRMVTMVDLVECPYYTPCGKCADELPELIYRFYGFVMVRG